jgi:hypothetical protein
MRLDRVNPGGFTAGLVFLALGFVFILEELGIWHPRFALLAPLIVVALGLAIVLTAFFRDGEPSNAPE